MTERIIIIFYDDDDDDDELATGTHFSARQLLQYRINQKDDGSFWWNNVFLKLALFVFRLFSL